MSAVEVPTGISVCSLVPMVCSLCVGRPPVLFPVACQVSFLGRPVVSSCLNIGCWGAVGISMSKKRKHGPDLRADL